MRPNIYFSLGGIQSCQFLKVSHIYDTIFSDQQISVRRFGETLEITREHVRFIIQSQLSLQKLSVGWVPKRQQERISNGHFEVDFAEFSAS